jgi:pyruvate kinase
MANPWSRQVDRRDSSGVYATLARLCDKCWVTHATPNRAATLRSLRAEVAGLRERALNAEQQAAEDIAAVDPVHRVGATNLVHYLALRRKDLRPLQRRLTAAGLSSLGRMEGAVLANLDAVLLMVDDALDDAPLSSPDDVTEPGRFAGLPANAQRLLGPLPDGRNTRIMVTMPSEAADPDTGPELVAGLVDAGMDVARINCAHDGPAQWLRMAEFIRAAGPTVRIAFDLAGPKLRTGPIEPGARVHKVKPVRDASGRTVSPAVVRLDGRVPPPVRAIPVPDPQWLSSCAVGDVVTCDDARGRHRVMRVTASDPTGVMLAADRTTYFFSGQELSVHGKVARVGDLPALPQWLVIHSGDTITMTQSLTPVPATDGTTHSIGCTLPEALAAAKVGQPVAFDDGKIHGRITAVDAGAVTATITYAAAGGTKLRAEKGINLPDTDIPVPALTDEDRAALASVAGAADIIELSFVRSAFDVRLLTEMLDAMAHTEDVGVVVKIETKRGFANLPEILLELMRRPRAGVMIARGDLGVEAGFERLAEVQEELLWICEAAQVPVIWATQVLDTLAATGLPTRAEVTDAAAANRAEAVMLNKGPYIVDAIAALDNILRRMKGHVDKKRPLLRQLAAWQRDT